MTVYLLPEEPMFPPATEADPDGLIAIGGDLSVNRLLNAYASGIFPWFMEGKTVYWYSPDPRMVLFPEKFRISDSLKRLIRSKKFTTKIDTRFGDVIRACSEVPRPDQEGTWISNEFVSAYTALFKAGFAHSFECYEGDQLVGGLYGVSLGRAFFGESMFHYKANASKVAYAELVSFALNHGISLIDCQMETSHLQRLGAENISREHYLQLLNQALQYPGVAAPWRK
jgi:leucyl/phenylalanyl-tRNA--protein transferase